MVKTIPEGWHTVTPRLVVRDPRAQVRFLEQVFGATGELRDDAPTVLRIGDSIVMVSGTGAREQRTALLHVYVPDVDATYERALQAGAEVVEAPSDLPYGDRRAMVKDPCGNEWQIATPLVRAEG